MLPDVPIFCVEPSAPPSNIRVSISSSTRIVVEWNEVPQEHRNREIQGYRVLYSGADGPNKKNKVDAPTSETTLIGLKKSTLYTIKVLAFTDFGDGPPSSGISVTTAADSKCYGRRYARNVFTCR